MRRITTFILTFLFPVLLLSQGETYVCTWQNNAQGAAVFTLDDYTWSHYLNPWYYNEVAPAMIYRHGLVGTFGIVSSRISSDIHTDGIKHNIGMGHSISNHGRWHTDMRIERPFDTLYMEIVTPKLWFDTEFGAMQTMDVFMFPYCAGLEDADSLAHSAYFGVRDKCGGTMDSYSIESTDNFTSFNSTNGSISEPEKWKATIDSAIAKNGYTMTLHHDINQTGQTAGLNDAFSYIREKVNEGLIWNATFRDFMKYGKERLFSDVTIVTNTSDLIEINITDTFPDDLFNVPLTLITKVPSDWSYAEIFQGGELIGVEQVLGDSVMYNAVPDQGLVQLVKVTEPLSVTGVDIVRDTVWILATDYWQLRHNVFPNTATNKAASWNSGNSSVVIVDDYGRLTAVAEGEATITLTSVDGSFTDQIVVYVYDELVQAESGVSLPSSITIDIGETYKLYATVSPANADNKNCTWVTEDFSVATVDNNGRVTGHSVGTTKVLVGTLEDGRSAYCTINVTSSSVIPVDGVSVNPTSIVLNSDETSQLVATISPSDASNKTVTWESDNPSVATVNSTGQVSAEAEGDAVITVTTLDGNYKATCSVSVSFVPVDVTGVTVSPASWSLPQGTAVQLTETVAPYNASNQNVIWSSDDEAIATVNSSGLVTAIGLGTTNITVTTEDGGFSDVAEINVTDPSAVTFRYLRFITFGANNLSLREADWMVGPTEYPLVDMNSNSQGDLTAFGTNGSSYYLYDGAGSHIYVGATTPFENGVDLGDGNGIMPDSLYLWVYPWGRADSIAIEGSNDNSNWVHLYGEADPFNGDTLLSYPIDGNVSVPVTGVNVSSETLSLEPTQYSTLLATLSPANASNQNVTWSSGNSSIATVDQNGMVTAVAEGTVDIVVTTEDGSYKDTCEVEVRTAVVTYTLTVTNGTGDGDYEEDEVVSIVAGTAPAGQEFDAWTGDITNVAEVNSASTTITMPASEASVTATYKDLPPVVYTLSVTNGTGGGDYEEDEEVTITANAAPAGQEFDAWTGNVSGIADVNVANTTLTMQAEDASITATYKTIQGVGVTDSKHVHIKLFPNPVRDMLNIHSAEQITGLKLMDVSGKVKMESVLKGYEVQMNLAHLINGIYILEITMENNQTEKHSIIKF